eukprot:3102314-Pyramimonas_sp.AAC.1
MRSRRLGKPSERRIARQLDARAERSCSRFLPPHPPPPPAPPPPRASNRHRNIPMTKHYHRTILTRWLRTATKT